MKRFLSLVLALAFCLSLCGSAFAESTMAADTFSCFITIDADIAIEGNKVLEWFEDQTNTKFNFVVKTGDDMLTMLLNTGDYPEIIVNNFNNDDVVKYGVNDGIFVAIDEYIDEYMPNVKAYLDEHPMFKTNITAPDGHIYGVPTLPARFSHSNIGRKLWINTQWLEKVGMTMPETTDDLYKVLVAFRDMDPNDNGKQDEVPLSGCINTWWGEPQWAIMQSFVYADTDNFVTVENGEVKFVANTEEYKQGLEYLKKLYDEKLLDPASFTQDLDQLSVLGNAEEAVLGIYACGHMSMPMTLENPNAKYYDPLVTPASPSGRRVALFYDPENTSGISFAVTDACHDVPRALQTIDAAFGEETCVVFNQGIRGLLWDYAEEGMLDFDGNQALYMVNSEYAEHDANNTTVVRDNVWDPFRLFCDTARTKYWVGADDMYGTSSAAYENRLFAASKAYEPYFPTETMPVIWADQDSAEAQAQLRVQITDYVRQATTRFITGDMDLETEWDSYVSYLNGLNLASYVQYYADGYAAALAK